MVGGGWVLQTLGQNWASKEGGIHSFDMIVKISTYASKDINKNDDSYSMCRVCKILHVL